MTTREGILIGPNTRITCDGGHEVAGGRSWHRNNFWLLVGMQIFEHGGQIIVEIFARFCSAYAFFCHGHLALPPVSASDRSIHMTNGKEESYGKR